jgi:hypothetical protein
MSPSAGNWQAIEFQAQLLVPFQPLRVSFGQFNQGRQ